MGKHSDNVYKNKHLVRKLREQSLPWVPKVNTNQAFPPIITYYQTECFVSPTNNYFSVLAREGHTKKGLMLSGKRHFGIQSFIGRSLKWTGTWFTLDLCLFQCALN